MEAMVVNCWARPSMVGKTGVITEIQSHKHKVMPLFGPNDARWFLKEEVRTVNEMKYERQIFFPDIPSINLLEVPVPLGFSRNDDGFIRSSDSPGTIVCGMDGCRNSPPTKWGPTRAFFSEACMNTIKIPAKKGSYDNEGMDATSQASDLRYVAPFFPKKNVSAAHVKSVSDSLSLAALSAEIPDCYKRTSIHAEGVVTRPSFNATAWGAVLGPFHLRYEDNFIHRICDLIKCERMGRENLCPGLRRCGIDGCGWPIEGSMPSLSACCPFHKDKAKSIMDQYHKDQAKLRNVVDISKEGWTMATSLAGSDNASEIVEIASDQMDIEVETKELEPGVTMSSPVVIGSTDAPCIPEIPDMSNIVSFSDGKKVKRS